MNITVLVLMIATLAVLVLGLILMSTNKRLSDKYGNKLMAARIMLQAAAIIMLYFTYHTAKN